MDGSLAKPDSGCKSAKIRITRILGIIDRSNAEQIGRKRRSNLAEYPLFRLGKL
jgi:hypothetical protein